MKRANKDEKSAELVEGRGWTKGNTRETAALRPLGLTALEDKIV
jgi:hypothetical protein